MRSVPPLFHSPGSFPRPFPPLCGAVLALLSTLAPGGEPAPKEEYYQRLAKLPPRSAAAHVELATWCKERGLEAQALDCYRRAIAIDADASEAREALGYERRGLRWAKQGEVESEPSPRVRPRSDATAPGQAPRGPAPAPSAPAPPARPDRGVTEVRPATATATEGGAAPPTAAPPEAPPTVDSPTAEEGTSPAEATAESLPQPEGPTPEVPAVTGDAFAADVERKRAWAQLAAEKFQTPMATEETEDFIVHTTFSKSSRDYKAFQTTLRNLKKTVVSVLAIRSGRPVWPGKVQVVLLRSQPEFDRFAEIVDGLQPGRIPEGAYAKDDHTVVLRPDSEVLPRRLGAQAVEGLNGSDRHVGWWLVEGLSEWVVYASAVPARGQEIYRNIMTHSAEEIRKEDGLRIFDLVDSPENSPRFAERNRELAFSLIDFLFNYKRRDFQEFIGLLKSEKAPAPPQTKEEFNYFYASYVSFQEEAINSTFRQSLEDLDGRWKRYVLGVAEKLQREEPKPTTPAAKKKRN